MSPKDIVVARGARVTFVNNDGVGHDMNSDPASGAHELHGHERGLRRRPGRAEQTDVLNIARTCGYHDHNQPSNTNLQGTITIQ